MLTVEEIKTFIDSDAASTKKSLAKVGVRYYEGDHDIKNYRVFYVDGSEICTYVPGPVTYSSDGTIWLGVLLATAVIVRTPSQDGALTEGIYFIVTKAELGAGLMEFRAGAMSVHALHRFTSCPTLHGSAMPKYLDTLCVDRIVFRSPLGRLYALSVSDNGDTVFKEVGAAQ